MRTSTARGTGALHPGWVIVDGLPLYHRSCVDAGEEAPAIVHVHGFGISGTYLEPTAALLTHRFRTFVPDLPGMGRSMRRDRPLDLPGLAKAVIDYCDEVGVQRATFVGNSLGCPIICEVAASFPDRVDRAVLVSPAGGPMNQPLAVRSARWRSTAPVSRSAWCRSPCTTTSASGCCKVCACSSR